MHDGCLAETSVLAGVSTFNPPVVSEVLPCSLSDFSHGTAALRLQSGWGAGAVEGGSPFRDWIQALAAPS